MSAIQARADLIRAAIRCLAAEHADPHAHADDEAEYADELLALAARRLAREIDKLPAGKKPAGWFCPRCGSLDTDMRIVVPGGDGKPCGHRWHGEAVS